MSVQPRLRWTWVKVTRRGDVYVVGAEPPGWPMSSLVKTRKNPDHSLFNPDNKESVCTPATFEV